MHKTTLIFVVNFINMCRKTSQKTCQCATPLALKVAITTQHSSIQIGIEIVANERVCQASSFRVRRHETTLTVA